ncbi:MAG: response regulator transcription factor [Marinobacter sp.]|uniref:response regulator transcription factor n=1 Tax=Marinobacter sp. TaxID=50741 RepID=UPI0034A071E8
MHTRVLIVEDQTALAENLLEFLGEDHYSLDFAPDGLTALHLIATHTYDVIVLDIMLPGLSGLEICKRLRKDMQSSTPVIFMTARGGLQDKEEGFELGGDDYLVKPFALRELQLRIDALSRRRMSDTGQLRAGMLVYDPGTLEASLEGSGTVELSGTASRIFEVLMRHYPRFVSHEMLSTVIWGNDEGDTHTLRTHVYALRKTLQHTLGQSLIRTIHGRGYRLEMPGSEKTDTAR